MPESHRRKLEKLDADNIKVRFSPLVKSALVDLEAAVHFSKDFDADGKATIREWAHGEAPTVREVISNLPLLAENMFDHLKVTGDPRAEEAWDKLRSHIFEHGFTLTQRERQR